jgi:error-prone DNA polymerase
VTELVRDGAGGEAGRSALWAAGAVAHSGPDRLAGVVTGTHAPALPGMSRVEIAVADVWATGVSPDSHPIEFLRRRLDERDVIPIGDLGQVPDRTRVLVAGAVTHRQRPATADGVTFMNLEDETGMLNVVVASGTWTRYRRIVRTSPALIIRGMLERADGVTNLVADFVEPLPLTVQSTSRDFR